MARYCFVRFGLVGLALVAIFATPAAAQQLSKIGFVDFQGPALAGDIKHFRDGMTAFGHTEGKTYALEAYFTAGDHAKTRALVDTLIKKPVDVLVVRATPVAHIAKEAAKTI